MNQPRVPPPLLLKVLREVARAARVRGKRQVSIAFVTPEQMRKFNWAYRHKNRVTDVLAFPFTGEPLAGEVLICLAQARKQAKEHGHGVQTEVVILLVHGLLHIFGYDHETTVDAKKMFPLQSNILHNLGIEWTPPTV
jgi:probable rRNA maturation factor